MRDRRSFIANPGLQPHPEGGHLTETWRADAGAGECPSDTAIYCLLQAGDSHSADSLGAWTLVGCTVSPGFRFEGCVLAPPDWEPGR